MTVPSLMEAHVELDEFLLALDPDGGRHDDFEVSYFISRDFNRSRLSLGALKALLFATSPQEPTTTSARRGDPSTSHEAAQIAAVGAESARGKILLAFARDHLRGWSGMTSEGVVKLAGVGHQRTPWKRVSELKAAGLIEPTGQKVTGSSGAKAEVLHITEAGMEVLRKSVPTELASITAAVG